MRLNLQLFKGGNASGSGAETVDQTEARIADENARISDLNRHRGTVEIDGIEYTHGTMREGLEMIKDSIDPETGILPSDIEVKFHFADGHIEEFVTSPIFDANVRDMPMRMGRSFGGGGFAKGVDGVAFDDGDGRFFFAGKGFSFQNMTVEDNLERHGAGIHGDLYHDVWGVYGNN